MRQLLRGPAGVRGFACEDSPNCVVVVGVRAATEDDGDDDRERLHDVARDIRKIKGRKGASSTTYAEDLRVLARYVMCRLFSYAGRKLILCAVVPFAFGRSGRATCV